PQGIPEFLATLNQGRRDLSHRRQARRATKGQASWTERLFGGLLEDDCHCLHRIHEGTECTRTAGARRSEILVLCTLAYRRAPSKLKRSRYTPSMPDDVLGNRLLAVLAPEERDRLLRGAKSEPFDAHQVLYTSGREISHVYFPVSGVVSLVIKMRDAKDVEATTIGNEGLVGIPVILGVGSTTMEALGQIRG